jgi:hypothetical protein
METYTKGTLQKKLQEAASAKICYSDPTHGTHLLRIIVGELGLSKGGFLDWPVSRCIRGEHVLQGVAQCRVLTLS